jgi:hypothetical protein
MAFKDILKKQRQSGAGITSSLGTAASSSIRESLDIRNYLFTKGSLLNALFPNVKGFKSDAKSPTTKSSPTSLLSLGGTGPSLSDSKLDEINQNTKISAKNSLVLPSMARDMNVMRQNIVKLVKLSGGTPASRADMFFLKAKERESLYENQMGKSVESVKDQQKVDSKTNLKMLLLPLMGLSALLTGMITAITTLGATLAGVITSALVTLGTTLTTAIASLATKLWELISKIPSVANSVAPKVAPIAAAAVPLATMAVVTQQAETADMNSDSFNIFGSTARQAKRFSDWFNEFTGRNKKFEQMREKSREGLISPQVMPPAQESSSPAPTPAPTSNQSSGLNIESIMAQVRKAEGGSMGYDAANRGKAGDTPGGMPGLSSMTVGEVRRLQKERQLFAAGAYQIIPDTMDMIIKNGIAKDSDIFNKETQDKMGRWLINRRIRIAERQGTDPQKELSKEFASIANPETGQSYYAGVGNNKASIASLGGSNNTKGQVLNTGSIQVSDARTSMAAAPVIISAPQTNVQSGSTISSSGRMPSVVDSDFMKHLTRIAV